MKLLHQKKIQLILSNKTPSRFFKFCCTLVPYKTFVSPALLSLFHLTPSRSRRNSCPQHKFIDISDEFETIPNL
jgi:hypothetical protein